MPAGLEIEQFGGTSWVGLVPFRMEGVTRRGLPDVPGLSAFAEMNLRLYVTRDGKPGVWFVSLDAANRLAVCAARRLLHLPYFHARMHVAAERERIRYASARRRSSARVAFSGVYWPTSDTFEASPGSVEHFLTERYCLYAQAPDGAIERTDIHHRPWRLQVAQLEIRENTVAPPQGVALDGPPALLHFSPRLDVVVWNPIRVN